MASILAPAQGFIIAMTAFCIGLASHDLAAMPKAGCADRVQDRLFLGLSGPAGTISDAEWERFVETTVTPRFPDGLTIVQATGQWQKRDSGVTREASQRDVSSRRNEAARPLSPRLTSAHQSTCAGARADVRRRRALRRSRAVR